MDNKKLGLLLIIISLVVALLIFGFNLELEKHVDASCACADSHEGGFCPHEQQTSWMVYAGLFVIGALVALSVYLLFFEKSQQAILSTLEKQKQIQVQEEKFAILLIPDIIQK